MVYTPALRLVIARGKSYITYTFSARIVSARDCASKHRTATVQRSGDGRRLLIAALAAAVVVVHIVVHRHGGGGGG